MRIIRMAIFAAACGLAACQPAQQGEAATAVEPQAVEMPAPSPPVDAAPGTYATPSLAPPPSDAPSDEFVGWYYEKGAAGMLVSCGQAVPLQVTDASFLHQLNARRGGSGAPVYVRMEVRPAPGSKLEVAKVLQFGVDEGPAPDCALNLAP